MIGRCAPSGWTARTAPVATVLGCLLITAVPGRADAALEASAGVGGVARAGRWLPVRVSLEARDADVAGEIVAHWGDAVVRRRVVLTAPGRHEVELHLRTDDPRPLVTVRWVTTAGSESTEATVRIAPLEELVTICVGLPGGPSEGGCTARVAPASLPVSPRGYDAVDEVRMDGRGSLDRERRVAWQRWWAMRQLEQTSSFTPVPGLTTVTGPLTRASRLPFRVRAAALSYGMGLVVLAAFAVRQSLGTIVSAVTVATTVGLAAAGSAGRSGSSAIVLHHTSLVQQVAGADVAAVAMRAVAVYPGFDDYALTAEETDASFRRDSARAPYEEELDAAGRPVVNGRHGLGGREWLRLEAFTAHQPFTILRQGNRVRVTNATDVPFIRCVVAPESAGEVRTSLGPGAAVEVESPVGGGLPVVWCETAAVPVSFSDRGYRVETIGVTRVSAFEAPEPSR